MSSKAIHLRRSAASKTVVAGGGGGGGGGGTTTFGPETATGDWHLESEGSFETGPTGARIGDDQYMSGGYLTYAMMWNLDVAAGVDIDSATLKVTTTSSGGNGSAVWYLGTEAGIGTSEPLDSESALSAVNRGGSGWSASGVTPTANSTEYSIDVKTEIVAIIARDSWATGGMITLFLSGTVAGDTGEEAEVESLVGFGGGEPNLTVVYS